MSIDGSYHAFDGWDFNIYAAPYAGMPTLTASRAGFTADSCMDHPEPARGTFVARCPAAAADLLDIEPGGAARAFVWAPDRAGVASYVSYFEGVVDVVTIAPVSARGPVAFHAVPTSYAAVSLPAGVGWATRGAGGAPMGLAGGVLVLDNSLDVEATVTFRATFPMSGPATRGQMRSDEAATLIAVNERTPIWEQGAGALISYAGELISPDWGAPAYGWSWADPATAGPATITVKVPAASRCEYLPVLAQDTGNAGRGHVELTIETSDYLAPLGRVRVGAEPWEATSASARILEQLGPAAARAGIDIDAWPYRDEGGYETGAETTMAIWVRALDVDSRSALDVYQRTVAAVGRSAIALAGRVGISWALMPSKLVVPNAAGGTVTPDLTRASLVPSSALTETSIRYSTDRVVNRIAVEHVTGTPQVDARAVVENPHSIARHGEVTRTIATDCWVPSPYTLADSAPNLNERAALALAAQSTPEWELGDPLRVVVDPDVVVGCAELIDNAQRFGRLVTLTGPLPRRVEAAQRCRGQAFGFGGGRWNLELLLEPASYAGVEAARFRDAAGRGDLTLYNLRAVTLADVRDAAV